MKWSDYATNERAQRVTPETIRETLVSSPTALRDRLENLFGDKANETIACVFKTYFWLAYAGLRPEDAVRVKANDINFGELVVRHNDNLYRLYEQSAQAVEAACDLNEFVIYRPRGMGVKPRAYGDEVLRLTVPPNLPSLRAAISRAMRRSGEVSLKYTDVQYSGLFYRVYSGRKSPSTMMDIETRDYIREYVKGDVNKERPFSRIQERAWEYRCDIKRNYNDWVEAFGLERSRLCVI